jgi:hypothetical protein
VSAALQPAGQVAFHDLGRAGLDHLFPVAVERHYQLAGKAVRIAFSTPALARNLDEAISHLARESESSPDLTLHVADRSTWPDFAAACDSLGESAEAMHLWDDGTTSGLWHQPWNLFSFYDTARARGIFAAGDPERIPYYEKASIFRTILEPWLRSRGLHLAHGAVVGSGNSGLLLAGRSGRGKSTLSLACIMAGFATAGDDFVPLEITPEPRAWPLYAAAKVFPSMIPRFQQLGGGTRVDWQEPNEKAILYFPRDHPSFCHDSLRLKAIVLPRYTGGSSSRLLPGSKAEALRELLASPQMMARGGRASIFDFLTALTRRLPVYLFETGDDWNEMTSCLRELLATLEQST